VGFSNADRIEDALQGSIARKPPVIFLGKGPVLDHLQPHLRRKLEMLVAHLGLTMVGVGPPGIRWAGATRFVTLPEFRPRPLSSAVFYSLGPAIAVGLSIRRQPRTIVCLSPYEGAGVILISRIVPAAIRPRVVVEVHGDWRTATRLYGSAARQLLAPFADRVAVWALRRADRVRVVSEALGDAVQQVGYVGEIDRFPTFSDLGDLTRDEPFALPGQPSVAFIGVMEPYKGVDVLLDAWSIVRNEEPGARLLLAGDGTRRAMFERQAQAPGHDRSVEFLGEIPHGRVGSLLDRTQALVLPSRSEGLARVILEAFARARPVIATRVGGASELIEHRRSGLLVPPEDPPALANAILELFADREGAARMGAEARQRVVERDPLSEYDRGLARLAMWASTHD
jgi:glycosyltransferase involved in cell wall biosynthesis